MGYRADSSSIGRAAQSRSTAAASGSTPKWSKVRSTSEEEHERAEYPDDLYYTKDHEWARLEDRDGQKLATIGVTRSPSTSWATSPRSTCPRRARALKQAEVFGSVESVKAVSDLFAPLSGKIVKVNSPLADSPEYVNEDPYDEGWMIQVAVTDAKELDGLMDAAAYQAFLREQGE